MINKGINKNNSNPLCKRNIGNTFRMAIGSEGVVWAMANRPHNGNGKVPSITESSHYYCEPEEFGWWSTHKRDQVPQDAAYQCTEQYVNGNEPPKGEITERYGFPKVGEDQAWKKEGENEFTKELEGRPG